MIVFVKVLNYKTCKRLSNNSKFKKQRVLIKKQYYAILNCQDSTPYNIYNLYKVYEIKIQKCEIINFKNG